MKNGRALNVPLSALAVRIMRAVMVDPVRPKESRFLFTTTGTSSVSGFRKGKDRMLNHVATATTSKIARIYNMSELFEQRRQASNACAALLESEVIGDELASVL